VIPYAAVDEFRRLNNPANSIRNHFVPGCPPGWLDTEGDFGLRWLEGLAYRIGQSPRSVRPGKPVGIAFIETYSRRFRDECLNVR
jgi:hypothetical protein